MECCWANRSRPLCFQKALHCFSLLTTLALCCSWSAMVVSIAGLISFLVRCSIRGHIASPKASINTTSLPLLTSKRDNRFANLRAVFKSSLECQHVSLYSSKASGIGSTTSLGSTWICTRWFSSFLRFFCRGSTSFSLLRRHISPCGSGSGLGRPWSNKLSAERTQRSPSSCTGSACCSCWFSTTCMSIINKSSNWLFAGTNIAAFLSSLLEWLSSADCEIVRSQPTRSCNAQHHCTS